MVGWSHRLNGHESEQTPGDSKGQKSLVCCSPWGHRVGHSFVTERQQRSVPTPDIENFPQMHKRKQITEQTAAHHPPPHPQRTRTHQNGSFRRYHCRDRKTQSILDELLEVQGGHVSEAKSPKGTPPLECFHTSVDFYLLKLSQVLIMNAGENLPPASDRGRGKGRTFKYAKLLYCS